ncbi:MAG: deoxyribonuclease IV [Thermodesulfovibrionales bacterium]|nr:deoxyribonuclease IV [Thermodesulfovibrionales bacterium]
MKKERRLGVHTSIAGGVHLSIERAKELGCNTVQIFSHNPRQWFVNEIPKDNIRQFRKSRELYDIDPVYIHTSYLVNLAASNNYIFEKSIHLLIQEMDIADSLDADYVILHTGSASQDSEDNARRKAIEALKIISKQKTWNAKLLLENTAGERGDISSHMKDLAGIIDNTNSALISGVCIDTCHAFAAGYNISNEKGIERFVNEIKLYLGIDSVKLIHLNDSKKGCNSHVDRHEHIGEGGIGRHGLKRFINHPAFENIPLILETPKKSEEDDPRNLKIVKGLF